jgi:hypothetical protein
MICVYIPFLLHFVAYFCLSSLGLAALHLKYLFIYSRLMTNYISISSVSFQYLLSRRDRCCEAQLMRGEG